MNIQPLSAHDILNVWEIGQYQHTLDRVLSMLLAACPGLTRDEIVAKTIAQRDMLLFELYEKTFGSKLNGFAECPQCDEKLEFAMSTADLKANQESDPVEEKHILEMSEEGIELVFRLPDSMDLAALTDCTDVQTARSLLVQRCIQEATQRGVPISASELSAEAVARLAKRMEECAPQADAMIELSCPACGHSWQLMFDIADFLWTKISAEARRLLREVHTLATAYGWRETDILSMSPVRRRMYMEMFSQ